MTETGRASFSLQRARDAMLVAGLLVPERDALETVTAFFVERYGPVVLSSEPVAFTWTDYYAAEMGEGLIRQFVAFEQPVYPGRLKEIKTETCRLEHVHAHQGRRAFNLDPGYLTLSTLIVASTKEASYRTYLGDGIYAQPMLVFRAKHFHPFEWTYADYRHPAHVAFFEHVRKKARDRRLL